MLNHPLMPSLALFDPFVEAINRGVRVRFGGLARYTSALVPSVNMVVVAARLPDAVSRYAVAHQLVHLELDALSGLMGPAVGRNEERVEAMACTSTARLLLPTNQLRKALMESDQAEDVAEILEVPVAALSRRVGELTPAERAELHPMTHRLAWPSDWPHSFVCGRFETDAELNAAAAATAGFNTLEDALARRKADDEGLDELVV